VRFVVFGRDSDAFEQDESDVHEAHQSYMDGWLPRMFGRGPIGTPDGELHAGSVHVIEADDLSMAREFAFKEPYQCAGWYTEVLVRPMRSIVEGTMWDRPAPAAGQVSSFVWATWSARPIDELRVPVAEWLFAGQLLSENLLSTVGFAGAVDLSPKEAAELARDWPGAVEVHRWERGGRRD
jgi:hypothetical protein